MRAVGEDGRKEPVPVYRRLADIEARLARLEEILLLHPNRLPTPAEPTPAPPPQTTPITGTAAHEPVVPPPVAPPVSFPPSTPPPTAPPPASTPELPSAPPAGPPAPPPPRLRAQPRTVGSKAGLDLERLIAERWYALAGGLVVVIGIGLIVRLAYQRDWFAFVSGPVRCLLAAIFGVAILIAADVAKRRINAWAAAGMNVAGLGTLYVAGYAAYALYGVFGQTEAMGLLVACTALGVFISLRANLPAVAIAALIGGYLAPFIVGSSGGKAWVLPPYWLMLLATGLLVAGWRGGWFILLRWLTGWSTIILGGVWVLFSGSNYPLLAMVLLAATWGMVHAELWWSSQQGEGPRRPWGQNSVQSWSPMLTSFGMTGWAVTLAIVTARSSGIVSDWVPPAGGVAVTAILSLVMVGHLRLLRDPPVTAAERLGAALLLQTAALLITTIALGVAGWTQALGWIGMGAAAIAAGRWAAARPVIVYGLVIMAIGVGRIVLWDSFRGGLRNVGGDFIGLQLTLWSALASIAAAGCLSSAWMLIRNWRVTVGDEDEATPATEAEHLARRAAMDRFAPAWTAAAVALTAAAAALLMMAVSLSGGMSVSVLVAWMVLAGLFCLIGWRWPVVRGGDIALCMACVTLAAWATYFPVQGWDRFADVYLLHRGLLLAVVLAAEVVVLARFAQSSADHDDPPTSPQGTTGLTAMQVCTTVAAALLLVASSFEVARVARLSFDDVAVHGAAVSVWWGVFSIGLLVIGFALRHRLARRAGLALLAAATLKALVFDTASVSAGWRSVSVLGLGLMMLGVGVVYAQLSRREINDRPKERPDEPSAETD